MAPSVEKSNSKPYSLWRSAHVAPILAVGAFEMWVWTVDPLGVHTALNDGKRIGFGKGLLLGAVNSLPLVSLWALSKGKDGLLCGFAAPMYVITFNQWIFWWWPYLLGNRAGCVEMIAEHQAQLRHLPRLLPTIENHLVPDIEHTLLQPLSLWALRSFHVLLTSKKMKKSSKRWLLIIGGTLTLTQLGFVFKSPKPWTQLGPILAWLQSTAALAYTYSQIETLD